MMHRHPFDFISSIPLQPVAAHCWCGMSKSYLERARINFSKAASAQTFVVSMSIYEANGPEVIFSVLCR